MRALKLKKEQYLRRRKRSKKAFAYKDEYVRSKQGKTVGGGE